MPWYPCSWNSQITLCSLYQEQCLCPAMPLVPLCPMLPRAQIKSFICLYSKLTPFSRQSQGYIAFPRQSLTRKIHPNFQLHSFINFLKWYGIDQWSSTSYQFFLITTVNRRVHMAHLPAVAFLAINIFSSSISTQNSTLTIYTWMNLVKQYLYFVSFQI